MGTFIVFLDAGYAFTKITSMGEGHSLLEQPAERGEALTVTDYQAVCHRSCFYIFLEEPVLSSDGPVSLQLRAFIYPMSEVWFHSTARIERAPSESARSASKE